ncbi:MAG: hypothetical protein ACREQB_09310, partial [Candidatus Binataceae bacterium]
MKAVARRHLRAVQIAAALAAVALLVAPAAPAADHGFAPRGAARELTGVPGIYEWTFAATRGASPFDRIALHRIARGPTSPANPTIVLLYLPGTNMNGEV